MTLLHQAAQKAVEALEREAFEAWARGPAGYVDDQLARYADGSYQDSTTLVHWSIWRAACKASRGVIAALQQQPEPVAVWQSQCKDGTWADCTEANARAGERYGFPMRALYTAPPALQQQEEPRESVADFDTWQQNPYTKVLMDSIKNDYMPRADAEALIRAAASPSTTRQQEVGND